ncbi:nickel pincer cofactor biosynthesis protein LarB [Algibacillus agarilyticus]|uniref:nickel pincer cofactor biosynthesis protein LarB n=1 Tax=Algibacillus agarilyticus TaxID=2234133 RepID=UPI000DCFAE02|nr:nickel pincer cofactor biosynthesis protein LarB [Algibacillus agarilyticus]
MPNFTWDSERNARTGIAEAVFCSGKCLADIQAIIAYHIEQKTPALLTRLDTQVWSALPAEQQDKLDYDPVSRTALLEFTPPAELKSGIAIVAAGTSDLRVAQEAARTLLFNGFAAPMYLDIGVAGLWRLMDQLEAIRQHKIIIAVAGMEGAIFSVLGGLLKAPIIAAPSAIGYGISEGGTTALHSALASCAPGVMAVNIDNGFGAACSAVKIMNQFS